MSDWIDSSKQFRCRICDHPDWCSYNRKTCGWICMRVPNTHPTKNGGYWYPDGENKPAFIPKPKPEAPQIDAAALMNEFRSSTRPEQIARLAIKLGVTTDSLTRTGCAWAAPHKAFAFPMVNGRGNPVGIRLRAESGAKWSVKGGREGIFIPHQIAQHNQRVAYIVEGPTDLAACLTLGLDAIGRPSCRGSVAHTQVTINRLHIQRAILVSDNDAPGIDGAKALADELQIPCAAMLLPAKDMRQFVAYGGSRMVIESLERQLVWRNP